MFTLFLDNRLIQHYYFRFMDHQTSKSSWWNDNFNLQPGILIRYFNGIEEKFALNETFLRVDRLVISPNGHNIAITGIKLREPNTMGRIDIVEGIFIFKISKEDPRIVELVQEIPYAQLKD